MRSNRMIAAFFVLLLSALGAASQQKPRSNAQTVRYKFESEPRAVLSEGTSLTARHPKLYLRPSNLYMLAIYKNASGNSQLGLASSHDGGDAFEQPVMISDPQANVSSHGENSPVLAINGVEFYALWEQSREEGGTDLLFARSLRFGRKFEKPIRVTDKATHSTNAFAHLGVAPNGDIYAVWLDGRDPKATAPGTLALYLAKSTDRGETFGKNVALATGVCPCCRPTIAFGGKGEIHVSWRHVFDGDIRDIVVATSLDNGATFGKPARVAVDNWKISGCPHSGSVMQVKGNRLFVAWFSEANGTNAGVRLSWSDDGGRNFSKPVIASGNTLDANHPALSLSEDGRLLLIFQARDPGQKDGWGAAHAHLVEVGEDGTTSPPEAVKGNRRTVSYPVLAAGTVGRVYVAWTESTEKGLNVFLSRGRRESPEVSVEQKANTPGKK